jgi:hypothetical protein
LLLFNGKGDCLAAKLRPGNGHSADGWKELLLPEIDRHPLTRWPFGGMLGKVAALPSPAG